MTILLSLKIRWLDFRMVAINCEYLEDFNYDKFGKYTKNSRTRRNIKIIKQL